MGCDTVLSQCYIEHPHSKMQSVQQEVLSIEDLGLIGDWNWPHQTNARVARGGIA
jgi:hypothetical protein